MFNIISVAVLVACFSVGAFFAGFWYGKSLVGINKTYVLTENLSVDAKGVGGSEGLIPMGTHLYEYKQLHEISTYVLFVNIKGDQGLVEYSGEGRYGYVSPLSGYFEFDDGKSETEKQQ